MAEKLLEMGERLIKLFGDRNEKMQTLGRKWKNLSGQAADNKVVVEDAKLRPGQKRKHVVENWFKNVEMVGKEVQELEKNGESKIRAFFWGSRIDKLIKEIEELREEGRFPEGLLLDTTTAEPLLAPESTIQRSKRNFEEFLKDSEDDEVFVIGIRCSRNLKGEQLTVKDAQWLGKHPGKRLKQLVPKKKCYQRGEASTNPSGVRRSLRNHQEAKNERRS